MCLRTIRIIEYLEVTVNIKKVVGIAIGFLILLWVIGRFVSIPSRTTATNAAASPADQSLATDKWHVTEDHSPMDDSRIVVLSLESDDVIQGPVGSKKPKLVVRCKEGKTQVYVVTGMAATVEEASEGGPSAGHTVRLRIDQNSPQTATWWESTSDSALFNEDDAIAFAKQLAQANLFTFQFTPFDANPAIARFDLRGLNAHLGKVADACGWLLK